MFNPARLALARKRRAKTKITLARESGLGLRTITACERGEKTPSDESIAALSKTLRFPPEFFSAGDVEEANPEGASFRALTSLTALERGAALAAGALAFDLSAWLDERFENLPVVDVPSLRGFSPEDAAQALRAEWGLGEKTIRNTVHLLEAHGVRVFSLPMDSARVDAFSVWRRETPFIFLTTGKSAERGRFDATHELAHLTLHRHGGPHGRDAESEADCFASAFLMPKGSVTASFSGVFPTLPTLIRQKQHWLIAVSALTRRLRDLHLISEWHYRTLCIEISQQGYRTHEPNGIPRETSQILTKAFAALRLEGVSRGAVARELRIGAEDLEELIFGLVIASVSGGRSGREKVSASQRPALRLV
jgi:Zn-dependent peptidase ImmA (M78 family)/DNA-binding XRE family transcriptional regulator